MEDFISHPDYATVVTALAQGVKQSTELILDNLGIKTKLSSLPSWDEYVALRRKMENGFTSTRVYRFLFPGRHRRLWEAYIDAQERIQQELLTEVLG